MEQQGPIEPAQLRLAERRLLEAMRRLHRREPLRTDVRVDRLVSEVRAADPPRPSTHRGRQPLTISDNELRAVVDELVVSGALRRDGHRVRLADRPQAFDPIMRERIDQLIAALRDAGATPPPAETVAARLGIPAALLDELRAAGELVAIGPRIDYARATWAELTKRLDDLAGGQPLSTRSVRDALGTTRRHADVILRRYTAERDRRGVE